MGIWIDRFSWLLLLDMSGKCDYLKRVKSTIGCKWGNASVRTFQITVCHLGLSEYLHITCWNLLQQDWAKSECFKVYSYKMLPKLINSEAWFKYLCAELDTAAHAHNSFDVPRIYARRLVCLCQRRVKLLCLSDHWEKWARRCISDIFWCQQVTLMIRFLVSTLLLHNSVTRARVWTLSRQQQSPLELYICTT